MIGRFRQLRDRNPDIAFVEYDYDIDLEAVKAHKVWKTLPVLILYEGETELCRFIGEKSYKEIAAKVEELRDGQ